MVTVWLLFNTLDQMAKIIGEMRMVTKMVTVGTGSFFCWFSVPNPIKHDNSGRQQQMLHHVSSGVVAFYRV